MRLSKYVGVLVSLVIFLVIGIGIDIWTIGADEYAKFDHSLEAANKAFILEHINSVYLPLIFVLHMIFIILIFRRNKRLTK